MLLRLSGQGLESRSVPSYATARRVKKPARDLQIELNFSLANPSYRGGCYAI